MANLKCKFELFCDPEWKVSHYLRTPDLRDYLTSKDP